MNLLYKLVNHWTNSWPRGISQLQDTACFLKESASAEPSNTAKLKESKCVVTAHSPVVKSSCVGPLHCGSLGSQEASLLLLANKTRLVLQRNPILMVRKPKTWQVLFPFQVSTQVELIGTASYARIASNLTAKVGSRGFLVGEGNSSVKLKKPWRITPNSPKFSCLGSSMWRDAELYLLVLPTSSRDATFVRLGLQCLANGTDLPKEGRVSCLLLISPPQKRR